MSEQTPTFTDSPEQARVVNAPVDDDVLVVAGAGSGKTYTMTRRIITLIERGVRPERILGLTFTRKAASELLARVSAAVAGSPQPGAGADDGLRAFLKPEVSTYDAFFQSIVRQYGLLVGFDQNTQPLSEAGAMQLASGVIDRHLDLVLAHDFGSFSALVGKVLALSDAIGSAMIGGEVTTTDEAIERIRQWDADFLERLDTAIGQTPVPTEQPKATKPRRLKKDSDRQYADKQAAYREELHELCVYRCGELREVTRRRDTLLTLVQEYWREKRRRNMAEFSDFTIAAFQLVTRFPSIGERYRKRYTHVLLDEYQDTSTTQAMVIAALFHAKGRSAVNAVGDPFQSIYAWRGASPGAFRMFQRDFAMPEGSRPYPLSVTRRNSHIVLDAANNLTMPLRVPPRRRGSALLREVDVAELTTMASAPMGTLGVLGLTTFGQEIDAVARFARQAIARYAPTEHELAEGAKDQRPHVAVLFRGKTHMARFAQGLERVGLTTAVVGYSALLERADVRDLLALLHASADHTDSRALMRLLATARFGLEAADLRALAKLAERLDTAYRYRALSEAGLLDAGEREPDGPGRAGAARDASGTSAVGEACRTPAGEAADAGGERGTGDAQVMGEDAAEEARQAAVVKAYRDKVPHAVYLADLLAREDLEALLERARFDAAAVSAITRAGRMMRRVQAVANHPLHEAVGAAIEALQLDIDTVVAQALDPSGNPVNPTSARAGLEAIGALVDTYLHEIVEDTTPTLRGFMAWVDSLRQIDEESAAAPSAPADVVLMTIHQSKGLEWDAVAVVGMAAGTFPSSKGGLRVEADPDHPGTTAQGVWTPPEYRTSVATWLDDPAAVPVPVRVDAGILPRFPHDADPAAPSHEALSLLDDVEVIDDEIYGDMRGKDIGDDMDAVDPDSWYLTQGEEYGRRLLADERRLAYVALTRARHDALLTYSKLSSDGRDPRPLFAGTRKPSASKPSVFWSEVHDSMLHRPDIVPAAAPASPTDAEPAAADIETLDSIGAERPEGFFVGQQAADYRREIIDRAWSEPLDEQQHDGTLPWPATLSDEVLARLDPGTAPAGLPVGPQTGPNPPDGTGISPAPPMSLDGKAISPVSPDGEVSSVSPVSPDGKAMSPVSPDGTMPSPSPDGKPVSPVSPVPPVPPGDRSSLLARACLLVADPDLMPWRADDERELDRHVRMQAERLLAAGRQNVTSLQARSGRLNQRDTRRLWRGLVRPVPRVASPWAESGTVFHAWAERFITAGAGADMAERMIGSDADGEAGVAFPTTGSPLSREAMLAELAEREAALADAPQSDKDRRLALWQRRLAESHWAGRRVAWAERQIVVALPQLGGSIVNGKLDAVFHGGLDASDPTKRFTVVDWKTGRRPRGRDDISAKLVQLDWYRLLLSVIENVPLDSIDATLYYLSEPDEGARELRAGAKTEQEILAELSGGIPEPSDTD